MPFYGSIQNYKTKNEKKWIAKHLIALRKELYENIEKDRSPDSLIIGSWNIRAFDGGVLRENESYHYIAEIIGSFDICAIQEVKVKLQPLKRLVKLLGPHWSYFVTDYNAKDSGNSERMAYIYNTHKVTFRNLIGEIVIPKSQLINGKQIARTPYFASFQAGWFKFTLCSAHIDYSSGMNVREQEIGIISKYLINRAKDKKNDTDEVYVLMGDMNLEDANTAVIKELESLGMTIPLFGATNQKGNMHYDRMFFTGNNIKTNFLRRDKFDWRNAVFKHNKTHMKRYRTIAEKKSGKTYADWETDNYKAGTYKSWTTHEMSDHLPIWIELKIDYSNKYLTDKFLK